MSDKSKDNIELNDEEVKAYLDAWEKHKEEFPNKPFPRDFSANEKFGVDWWTHYADMEHWDEKFFGNSINVPVLMEQFCWFVKEKKRVPDELLSYVAKAFHEYLQNGKTLERSFRVTGGSTVKRNYDGQQWPLPLGHYLWEVIFEGASEDDAKKSIQERDNIKKSTLNDYISNARLVDLAITNVIASIELLEYRHLNEIEQGRIAKIIPGFKYIPTMTKEMLAKEKERDDLDRKAREKKERKNQLIKDWKLDEL